MRVAHGLWLAAGRLAIWGEASDIPASRRPGRPPRERPHPFAAPHDVLRAALGSIAEKAGSGAVNLWLPTIGGRPADSPELVRADASDDIRAPRSATTATLAAWQVAALEFDADDALIVLRRLPSIMELITSVDHGASSMIDGSGSLVLGAGIQHLFDVAAFATDLANRGRVLPAVATSRGPEAVWRPLLTGSDAAWARDLTAAIPPSARAEVVAGGETSSGAVVGAALDALTDAAVRDAIGAEPAAPSRRGGRGPAAARAWRACLTGPERRFAAEPRAVDALVRALDAWQHDAVAGPVRACFRLVEPGPDNDADATHPDAHQDAVDPDVADTSDADPGWRVEFLLQATDQPSLLVDAERVWRAGGELTALARHIDAPQETMLGELGRASRLWPDLDAALQAARPVALTLDADGAHRFLRDGAPLLHAAGFGVLLPSWWTAPGRRLSARLRAGTRTAPGTVAGTSRFGLDSIVDYQWQVALGDDLLTAAELQALADLKSPLVRVRGQWVEVDPKRLAAGLKLMTSSGEMSVGDLLHTGLATVDGPGGLPVTEVTADGALGDLLAGDIERHLELLDPPLGFHGTLRPYQQRGLAWLTFLESLGLGGVLADDMGLGKTVQLLALIAGDPPHCAPTLLVCPMSLVGNWQREAARFAPDLRVHVHHGAERARGQAFTDAVAAADIVVTTYALAARDAAELGQVGWHRVVLDEAQAIKNAGTRQATAVRTLPARARFAVTGTPVENRLADLWSLMDFASPGLLGTASAFKRTFAEPIERHGDEVVAARLRRMTEPFVLRRVKTDRSIISDLPDKLEMDVLCNLTGEQASLYQAVVDDMLEKIASSDGIERRGLVLATMTKLKQVCNHPAQLLHDDSRMAGRSGKLARLEEILEEVLAAGEKALLFTQYASFGGMLRAYLGARFGREVLFLHGGLGKRGRDEMVARFQSADRSAPPLFVLSLKAGGTGLTLTEANHVVHVDRWWNPAVEDQATDRAFRIGQRRSVQVRKFVCAGTVEEKIATMIRDKRGLAASIVGTGEGWLTELSTAALRDLLRLETGAVVE